MSGQQLAPGWYPDPDDPTARRYWDGANWSAPLPATTAAAPEAKPQQPKATWELAAEERGTALTARSCAVATCDLDRLGGSEYCGLHGMRTDPRASAEHGSSRALVCPHCQTKGRVTSKQVKMKKGVSGGKLTGAALTLGISMLGTGLSRKETVTEMKCGNCRTTWHV